MIATKKIYVGLVTIFALSLISYVLLPHGALIQELAGVPVVVSLVGLVVQIFRDQAAHDRQLLLLEAQNHFSLGASSHMADVAFDKHAAFCEEYLAEVFMTLDTLFREGPSKEVLPHATNLFRLRRKYAAWLTRQLELSLEQFESALRKIGASDLYLRNGTDQENRQEHIEQMYKTFADVLGQENMGPTWQNEPLTEEVAMARVINGLRAVLGTEELTEMRTVLLRRAVSNL